MIGITNYCLLFLAGQILLIPAYLLLHFKKRRYSDYRRQRHFLLGLIISGLILPLYPLIPLKPIPVQPSTRPVSARTETTHAEQEITANSMITAPVSQAPSPQSTSALFEITKTRKQKANSFTSLSTVLPFLFPVGIGIGVVFFIIKLLRHCLTIRKIRLNSKQTKTAGGERIFQSHSVKTPFSSGIARPAVYLPASVETTDKEMIIKHESIHIRERHILWTVLLEFYASLFWFYPPALLCKKENDRLQELITDTYFASGKETAPRYARMLLHYASLLSETNNKLNFQLGTVDGNRFGERINSILNPRNNYSGFQTTILSVVLLSGTLVSSLFLPLPLTAQNNDKEETLSSGNQIMGKMDQETQESSEIFLLDSRSDSSEDFFNSLSYKINSLPNTSPEITESDEVKRTPGGIHYYPGYLTGIIKQIRQSEPDSIPYQFPLKSDEPFLTQTYGKKTKHPILGKVEPYWFHTGVDYAVPVGTSVIASGDGTVIETGYLKESWGRYVIIKHNYGICSMYAKLDKIEVEKDKPVKAGDVIGLSGSTGQSTGPHLHFGISLIPCSAESNDAIYVDPLNFLQR